MVNMAIGTPLFNIKGHDREPREIREPSDDRSLQRGLIRLKGTVWGSWGLVGGQCRTKGGHRDFIRKT